MPPRLLAACVAVVLAAGAAALVPDAVRLLSEIIAVRLRSHPGLIGPTWADDAVEAQFHELRDLVQRHDDLAPVVLAHLLEEGRETSLRYRECVFVAAHLWASTPGPLCDQGALFLRLLSRSRCVFYGKLDLLRTIVESLSERALSVTDSQGRTPLEYYLTFRVDRDEIDVAIATGLARRTPAPILARVSVEAMDCLPPQIWTQVFYDHNKQAVDDLDPLFAERPDPNRWKMEVRLARIRQMDRNTADDDVREMFEDVDLTELIVDLRGHFDYDLDGPDLDAIWRLAGLYGNHADLRDPFLDGFPNMFASWQASYQIVIRFFSEILLGGHGDDQWRASVLSRLVEKHLQYDVAFGYRLAQAFDGNYRYLLIHMLIQGLTSFDGSAVADDHEYQLRLLSAASQTCEQSRGNDDFLIWTSFLLALTLRTMMERADNAVLLQQLPEFDDDQLRLASVTLSMWSDFHYCMNEVIGPTNPALYDRIRVLIPDKCDQTGPGHTSTPPRRIQVRLGSDLSHDYELLERLGDGSFGTVYRAQCRRGAGQHEVAIKVMESDTPDTECELEFAARFCAGGASSAGGLVRVLDLVQYGPDTCFVMELVRGETLANWPLPADVAGAADHLISVTFQILVVLHRLHQVGWKHGDIQHLNNFMVEAGAEDHRRLVVLDFGYAHRVDGHRFPVACSSDLNQVYQRLLVLLYRVKLRLGLAWYDPAPDPLGQFEQALRRWPDQAWNCAQLLRDPVFDVVRNRAWTAPGPDRYDNFPDMVREQVRAGLYDEWMAQLPNELKRDLADHVPADLRRALAEPGSRHDDDDGDVIVAKQLDEPVGQPFNDHRVQDAAARKSSTTVIVICCVLGAFVAFLIVSYLYYRYGWKCNPVRVAAQGDAPAAVSSPL